MIRHPQRAHSFELQYKSLFAIEIVKLLTICKNRIIFICTKVAQGGGWRVVISRHIGKCFGNCNRKCHFVLISWKLKKQNLGTCHPSSLVSQHSILILKPSTLHQPSVLHHQSTPILPSHRSPCSLLSLLSTLSPLSPHVVLAKKIMWRN